MCFGVIKFNFLTFFNGFGLLKHFSMLHPQFLIIKESEKSDWS